LDSITLTFIRDVGIAGAVIVVLGKAMGKLAQTYTEFAAAMREDNQQRNAQIKTLLDINQSIAEQMALTRSSLEHLTTQGAAQEEDIAHLEQGVVAVPGQLREELKPLGESLREVAQVVEELDEKLEGQEQRTATQLHEAARSVVQQVSTQLDTTHTEIVTEVQQALTPLLDKLDTLDSQIRQTRQDIAGFLEQMTTRQP